MQTAIYLDHAATTRLSERALETMLPWLRDGYGNPSGQYALGRRAARALDDARSRVGAALGCKPQDVVFTGPGTESINAAIKGVALAQQRAGLGNHIVTTTVEHHAVLHSCEWLEKFGFEVTYVPVDGYGVANPEHVAAAINERTVLVSVMLAAMDKAGIAASAGSACNSATWEPSHVLPAIGMPLRQAFGVLRLTVGPENTEEEIDRVLAVLPGVVADSRANPRRV